MYTALLIDTLSIQSYIFGSNKLKENIGGSYIIEHLGYKKMIPTALNESGIIASINSIDIEGWKNIDVYLLQKDPSLKVEIGYIGGGNALLIFRNLDDANLFIRSHSRLILQHFPGLKMAYATHDFNYEEGEAYRTFYENINHQLRLNKSLYPIAALPFKHGIVDDCAWSNEAKEVLDKQSGSIISQMSKSRVNVVDDSQNQLKQLLTEEQRKKYTFTTELENLGQQEDKGYVAIVHADGNGMGIRFRKCNSLVETRKLSKGVADLADIVMKQMINAVVGLIEDKKLKDFKLHNDSDLPIRPLISGGDDITFVCEGRLGVHLAEKLLKFMTETPVDGIPISACAGVAIVHTKYPFYKAYQLAEELTLKAKEVSRGVEHSSWLHFMISTEGFSGTYEDIINSQFTVYDTTGNSRKLNNGPYRIDSQEEKSIHQLKRGIRHLTNPPSKEGWPRNKVMALRDALRRDQANQKYFLAEMKARNLKLPFDSQGLWNSDHTTPFYDMVELINFYPEELLEI